MNSEKSVFSVGCLYPVSLVLKRAKKNQIAPPFHIGRVSAKLFNHKKTWL